MSFSPMSKRGMFSGGTKEPVRIEGFDTSLAGRRAMILGSALDWIQTVAALESEQLYRGRSVLVIQELSRGATSPATIWRKRWDAVFRVKEGFDAQMLATYVANAPKPVRVVWWGHDVPRAIWSRWVKQDITILGCHETAMIGGVEWECILFPMGCSTDVIDRVLTQRGGGASSVLVRIRDSIQELAVSGAAVVWSNIDEGDARGGLYWYDPKAARVEVSWSKEEMADTLRSIADGLTP